MKLEIIGGSKNAKSRAKRQKMRGHVPPPPILPFSMGPLRPMGPPPHRAFVNGGPFPPPPPSPRFGPPPRAAFGAPRGPMPPPGPNIMPPPPQHLPVPRFGMRTRFGPGGGGMIPPPGPQMRSPPPPAPLIPPPGPLHHRHMPPLMAGPVPPPPPMGRRPPPLMAPRMAPSLRIAARFPPGPRATQMPPKSLRPNAKIATIGKGGAKKMAAKIKAVNDLDFTQDIFEENLLTTTGSGPVGTGAKKNRKRPFAKKR